VILLCPFLFSHLFFILQCACYMNSYTYVCVLEIKKKKKKRLTVDLIVNALLFSIIVVTVRFA